MQRCKLSALASLYDYLLNVHAISGGNQVRGVKRPIPMRGNPWPERQASQRVA